MFVSKEHHPQILSPDCYYSQEHFQREVEQVFRPSWICVAAKGELPRDGDFKTLELLGRPLLIRREAGVYHTYLNVCSHRYCMLTHAESGNMPTLRCQYHGWEYEACGDTCRIPEARNFRPLAPGVLGLKKFRTETCGQLIFVTLSEDAPSLRQFLRDGYRRMQRWFHDDLTFISSGIREVDANWKVVIENGLESYHITELHSKTFGQNPPKEICKHHVHDHWTGLNVDYGGQPSFGRLMDWYACTCVGTKPTYEYDHLHYFPCFMPGRLSVNIWIESIIPVSPAKTHNLGIAFCYAGKPGKLWTRNMAFWLRRWAKRWHVRVNSEDAQVIVATQRGLQSPEHPQGGLISTREERIVHFQDYIQKATGCGEWDKQLPAHQLPAEANEYTGNDDE